MINHEILWYSIFRQRLWQCHLYHLNCCLFSKTLEASRQRLQSPVQRSQRPELFVKGTGGTGATGRAFVVVMTFFPQLFQDLGRCWKEKMKKGLEFLYSSSMKSLGGSKIHTLNWL